MGKYKYISKFHFLTHDRVDLSHQQQVQIACDGEADWVQLRMKNKPQKEMERIAMDCWEICEAVGTKLIINDHVELAKKVKAYGVHLGDEDMPINQARQIIGTEAIIGGTANHFNDICRLSNEKVDYIGLGPFRYTSTKKKLKPILGLEGFRKIVERTNSENLKTPLIAIGGLTLEDVPSLCATGVYGAAISSAILNQIDKRHATYQFVQKLNLGMFSYC